MRNVPYPERFHADLQCFAPDAHTLIAAPQCYSYYRECFDDAEIEVISGKTQPDGHSFSYAAYNVARVGNIAFGLEKGIDSVVRRELEKRKISVCNVSQGYAACSVVAVGKKALITSDRVIAKTAEKLGMDCLYVSPENILLPGFRNGLIGGCVSTIRPGLFAACGSEFPNSFRAFFEKHGAILLTVPGQLFDFGGTVSQEGK